MSNTIKVTREQVEEDYPEIYNEFVESLRSSNSLSREIDLEKTNWYYTWGYFVKKAKTEEDRVLREIQSRDKFNMEFADRLDFEMSKVRVSITMEAGKYMRRDRVRKKVEVAEIVKQIVTETTKITMIIEQREHNIQSVIDSIPSIDEKIVPKEQIEQLLGEDFESETEVEEELDLDTILDKISTDGISSLTEAEQKFLDDQSQNG